MSLGPKVGRVITLFLGPTVGRLLCGLGLGLGLGLELALGLDIQMSEVRLRKVDV